MKRTPGLHLRAGLPGLILTLAGASLARADVVAVVSAKSSITTLTKTEVADLFLGKMLRFPDGTYAVPIDQPEGSPIHEEFYKAFTGKTESELKAHWSKIIFTGRGAPPKAVGSTAALRMLLDANPHAIAYVDRSAVDPTLRVVVGP